MMRGFRAVLIIGIVFPGLSFSATPGKIVGADLSDPISGLHWRRLTDPANPAAPPRLVLGRNVGAEPGGRSVSTKHASCVHAGDRVRLRREDGGTVQMSLEATALESGNIGDRVRARIVLTGALVEMKISGPGLGVLGKGSDRWR